MKFTLPGALALIISAIVIIAVGQFTLLQQARSQTIESPREPAPIPIVHPTPESAPLEN